MSAAVGRRFGHAREAVRRALSRRLIYVYHDDYSTRRARAYAVDWRNIEHSGAGLGKHEAAVFAAMHYASWRLACEIDGKHWRESLGRWAVEAMGLRDLAITANVALVYKVAQKVNAGANEDATAQAYSGLIRAVENFDPRRGFRFATLAWTVVMREARRQRKLADRSDAVCVANYDPQQYSGAEPHAATLSAADEASLREVSDAMALCGLDAREQDILTMRFGLDGGRAHKLDTVGEKHGISRERVRQLQKRAIKKLRDNIAL